jgi:hypothetical protein
MFLIVALFSVVFAFLITGINEGYSGSLNESQLDAYNRIDDLNTLASDLNESMTEIEQGNAADVVGGLLSSGFTVLKTTWTSFGLYTDITSDAVDNANLGESAITFKSVALIIGILLFIFAMVGILIGRDV